MNLYATQEPAAQANINRIELLGGLITDFAAKNPGPIRLASVGVVRPMRSPCFSSAGPSSVPGWRSRSSIRRRRSIAWCERRLSPLANQTGARIQFIRESIRRLIGSPELARALGPRELIYSAGLFDYLNTRSFCALLGPLYAALVKGGLLAVGNVAVNNPSRHAMEYFSGWFLIHRSAEELRAFANDLTPAPRPIEVGSEPLGVNLFLYVRR